MLRAKEEVSAYEVAQRTGVKKGRTTVLLSDLTYSGLLVAEMNGIEVLYRVNLVRRDELRQLAKASLEQFLPTKV